MTPDQKRDRNAASKRDERARRKLKGDKRLELWAPPNLHPKIKSYVRDLLNKCTNKAAPSKNKLDKD